MARLIVRRLAPIVEHPDHAHVAVLREGRIAAMGRPGELTGALPPTEIRYRQDGREVVLRTGWRAFLATAADGEVTYVWSAGPDDVAMHTTYGRAMPMRKA